MAIWEAAPVTLLDTNGFAKYTYITWNSALYSTLNAMVTSYNTTGATMNLRVFDGSLD